MKKQKPIRTPDATYLHLNKTDNFQQFFRGFRKGQTKRAGTNGDLFW